jgi:hypothetical protein
MTSNAFTLDGLSHPVNLQFSAAVLASDQNASSIYSGSAAVDLSNTISFLSFSLVDSTGSPIQGATLQFQSGANFPVISEQAVPEPGCTVLLLGGSVLVGFLKRRGRCTSQA